MEFKISKSNAFIFSFGIIVFSYVTIKASISSFTHDESFSYLHYIQKSFMDIITFSDWYTNNHVLNSLLMKYSEKLFGNSEVALRLPNLLLFIVYMSYSFLLFKRSNKIILMSMFAVLCTNNSIIDLFGLARGYGLSIGFMTMSIYHFIQSFYSQKAQQVFLFHFSSLLAILSSFILVDVYLALLITYVVMTFIDCKYFSNQKYHLLISNKVHLIPFLVLVIILYEPIRRVALNSDLNFGGKIGLYSDTLSYLTSYAVHGTHFSSIEFSSVKIIFSCIVLITTILIIKMIIKRDMIFWEKYKNLVVLNLLIWVITIEISLQHIIFNADYPIGRFSLFILPIYIFQFGFLLSFIGDYYKNAVLTVSISLAIISCLSFVSKADFYSCSEWEYDMETRNMMQRLSEYHSKYDANSTNVRIGINSFYEPTINFYRITKNISWLLPADRNGLLISDSYYYCKKEELDQLKLSNYKIIANFDRIKMLLVKK